MQKYVDELLPILLEKLSDASSSQKREVALWTLAQLVESTGKVIIRAEIAESGQFSKVLLANLAGILPKYSRNNKYV